jgi:ribonucleoside-diphosphate reductase alpha chain
LGLKANALYRDGSKLSQPLSTKSDSKEEKEAPKHVWTSEEVLEAARSIIMQSTDTIFKRQLSRVVERKKLPAKRDGFTQKSKIGGQTIFVRTGEYEDGTLGEIFIDMHKEGASYRSLLNCFAIAVSIGLQYGVPLEEFADKFTFTRFEPSGPVDHANIKFSTSIVDYVFRLLGFEYLNRTDLVHVAPEDLSTLEKSTQDISTEATGNYPVTEPIAESKEKKAQATRKATAEKYEIVNATDAANKSLMGDAPPCPKCGHTTIRNGTCYKCLNCGESLGCS